MKEEGLERRRALVGVKIVPNISPLESNITRQLLASVVSGQGLSYTLELRKSESPFLDILANENFPNPAIHLVLVEFSFSTIVSFLAFSASEDLTFCGLPLWPFAISEFLFLFYLQLLQPKSVLDRKWWVKDIPTAVEEKHGSASRNWTRFEISPRNIESVKFGQINSMIYLILLIINHQCFDWVLKWIFKYFETYWRELFFPVSIV